MLKAGMTSHSTEPTPSSSLLLRGNSVHASPLCPLAAQAARSPTCSPDPAEFQPPSCPALGLHLRHRREHHPALTARSQVRTPESQGPRQAGERRTIGRVPGPRFKVLSADPVPRDVRDARDMRDTRDTSTVRPKGFPFLSSGIAFAI